MNETEMKLQMQIADLKELLRQAPPMRSIDDPRYQAWKLRVDRTLEQ